MTAHILVAEDEAHARYSLVQMLSRAGYRVTNVADGEEALDVLHRDTVDLIVSDIRMGLVDGLHLLEASQQLDAPPAVILLTGYGSLETSLSALRFGVSDYLLKPVEPEQLLASVAKALQRRAEQQYNREAARVLAEGFAALQRRAHLTGFTTYATPGSRGARPQQADLIAVGALQIGTHRHMVQYHGRAVTLTPTEFAILRCLAEAPDHLQTYADLAHCVYGYRAASAESQVLLKTHVRNIRQKLSPATLLTIRGVGYRLTAT